MLCLQALGWAWSNPPAGKQIQTASQHPFQIPQKRLSYSQARQIKIRWCSLYKALNFQPLWNCSLEMRKKRQLLCEGRVPSIHREFSNQMTFCLQMCDKSVCISVQHKFIDQFVCLTQSWFLTPVISKEYSPRDCIQMTGTTLVGRKMMKKKHRCVTSATSQLVLRIFKPASLLLNNWVKLVQRKRVRTFPLP